MSEKAENPTKPAAPRGPESQKERWVKYGGNVVLASVVVVLIAAGITYLATTRRARFDTTATGAYSLKPQTKQILRDIEQKITLVSLYTAPRGQNRDEETYDFVGPVADLLQEYKRNSGGRIDVEVIDPEEQPGKVDALITNVTEKYGGEVARYREFFENYKPRLDELQKQVTAASTGAAPALPLQAERVPELVRLVNQTVQRLTDQLSTQQQRMDRRLEQKPPDYRGAVDVVRNDLQLLSQASEGIVQEIQQAEGSQDIPEPVYKNLADSIPVYQGIKKTADAVLEELEKLGELKLDDLRESLRQRNAILVMGEKDMRVLSFEDVWQTDPNIRRMLMTTEGEVKPHFAGEQQITSAILALTAEKKLKVAFVRAGGPPMAMGMPFAPPPPLSHLAGRLSEYNFEVLEKDLSGIWAIQQQMQQRGMPPMPEPSDEEIKDAIWIVLSFPTGPSPMGNADIGSKVAEHLKSGGSALVLVEPQGDAMPAALAEWGVTVRADSVAVHESVPASGGARAGDWINEAQRLPFVFIINDYGDHMLTRPIQSLDFLVAQAAPVQFNPKDGYEGAKLLPLPQSPRTWGETNMEGMGEGAPTYNAGEDVPPPLHIGAAVSKKDGGRLVVVGSVQAGINQLLQIPDRELFEQHRVITPRFPGNSEFLVNSVLWLAKMEPMIAISPSALQVNRIESIPKGTLAFWHWGVLLGILPLAVIAAGLLMFIRRRD